MQEFAIFDIFRCGRWPASDDIDSGFGEDIGLNPAPAPALTLTLIKMRMKKIYQILAAAAGVFAMAALLCGSALAQTTKVKGRVTDESGIGLPFVAVYFLNTTIGVSTDLDGNYSMETRDSTACLLCASILGYENQIIRISRGAYNEVNFRLKEVNTSLTADSETNRQA